MGDGKTSDFNNIGYQQIFRQSNYWNSSLLYKKMKGIEQSELE